MGVLEGEYESRRERGAARREAFRTALAGSDPTAAAVPDWVAGLPDRLAAARLGTALSPVSIEMANRLCELILGSTDAPTAASPARVVELTRLLNGLDGQVATETADAITAGTRATPTDGWLCRERSGLTIEASTAELTNWLDIESGHATLTASAAATVIVGRADDRNVRVLRAGDSLTLDLDALAEHPMVICSMLRIAVVSPAGSVERTDAPL